MKLNELEGLPCFWIMIWHCCGLHHFAYWGNFLKAKVQKYCCQKGNNEIFFLTAIHQSTIQTVSIWNIS